MAGRPWKRSLGAGSRIARQVEEAPQNSGFKKGDLVVGIVRRPDPVPCIACAVGEFDMCRNGKYTERGIKERNGFGSEHWRIEPEYAVRLDAGLRDVGVLMEPASVLAKAWDHISCIGERAEWRPKTVLVTGAGPIGLLAALMGAQRGLEVHVLDRVEGGSEAAVGARSRRDVSHRAVKDIGFAPDVVIECTGVASVVAESDESSRQTTESFVWLESPATTSK